jgi:hypothetical protein
MRLTNGIAAKAAPTKLEAFPVGFGEFFTIY